jgi:hypothetical protein
LSQGRLKRYNKLRKPVHPFALVSERIDARVFDRERTDDGFNDTLARVLVFKPPRRIGQSKVFRERFDNRSIVAFGHMLASLTSRLQPQRPHHRAGRCRLQADVSQPIS